MTRYNAIQNNFVAGELSPRLEARTDIDKYFQGMRQTRNGLVLPHGGFKKRSGTRFVKEVKDSSKKVRLIPFRFSVEIAYVIEMGDEYFRFYVDEGRLETGGNPVEVTSPFTEDEIDDVQFVQEADVMFMVHQNHLPHRLRRTSATSFALDELTATAFAFGRMPLRGENLDNTLTLTVTGASDPRTIDWSADPPPGGISNFDIGRVVWITDGTDTAYLYIVGITDSNTATGNYLSGTIPSGAQTSWALGMFSEKEGPFSVALHEGRLVFGGTPTTPDRVALSKSDSFLDFELEDPALSNAENADKAISRRMVSNEINAIRWVVSATRRLIIGTSGDEFFMQGENEDFLTPAGAVVRPVTSRGSAYIAPVSIDNTTIFVQRQSRKIRQLVFELESDDFVAQEMSILAEHITRSGIKQMAYQQDPDSILWTVLQNGRLVGWTVEQQQNVLGAHGHIIGGRYLGQDPQVVSIATIPQLEAGGTDQLWMVVKRTIDGSTVQYVEFLEDGFEPDVDRRSSDLDLIAALEPGYFVDSGLSLDNPVTITSISQANPAVVTAFGHGFSDGDPVRIRDVIGMTEVNMRTFTVQNSTTNAFELAGEDSSGYGAYVDGGTVREEFSTVTGLDHLEGETVSILADGAPHPDRTVSSGSVDLTRNASIIHVGLSYTYRGETMRLAAPGQVGPTTQGQRYRIQRTAVRLLHTLGLKLGVGPDPQTLETLLFRTGSDAMNRPPPMFTGDKDVSVPGGWVDEPTVFFEQDQPLPVTILSVMPRAEFNER